jgi:hypothetical protein
VPSDRMIGYWIIQRRLLPHEHVTLSGMNTDVKAETDLIVVGGYQKLAGMFRA